MQEFRHIVDATSNRAIRKYVRAIVAVSMAIGIPVCMAIAGWSLLQSVGEFALRSLWILPIAFMMAIVYRVVNGYGWAIVLRAMGSEVNAGAAIRVWLLAESSRWLPGSIWGYVSRASLASSIGVKPSTALASMLVELLLVIAAASFLSIPGCIYFYEPFVQNTHVLSNWPMIWIAVGCMVVCFAATYLCRRMISKKFKNVSSKLGSLQQAKLNYKTMWLAFAFFVFMNVFNGWTSWVVSLSIAQSASVPILAIIFATAAAWLVGFFAVFSPGGLIVRESAFAALLVMWLPPTEAIAVAVLARLLQFGAEAVAIAWIVLRRYLRRVPA